MNTFPAGFRLLVFSRLTAPPTHLCSPGLGGGRMAFHGTGRQNVCGDLFPGSDLSHKYFCVNSSCGAPSTGLSATPCLTGPNAPAGTPRHPTALGGSAGGGAAVPQPYTNPASEVPSPAEMEPDRPIGYGAFGVVWGDSRRKTSNTLTQCLMSVTHHAVMLT